MERGEGERERERERGIIFVNFVFEEREDPGAILTWKEADRIIIFRPALNL